MNWGGGGEKRGGRKRGGRGWEMVTERGRRDKLLLGRYWTGSPDHSDYKLFSYKNPLRTLYT